MAQILVTVPQEPITLNFFFLISLKLEIVLNNKEFTSGFVYTLFDRTNSIDSDNEELLKQRIDDIRKNDPYIYR